ncbi:hypothetical protein ACFE04_006941 [Oxalis oulophora]
MADFYNSNRYQNSESSMKNNYKGNLVAARPKHSIQPVHKRIFSLGHNNKTATQMLSDAGFFLLKLAALEAVRRVSNAKCPFVWRGIQGLQLLCIPPLKWIQRWLPLKGLINGLEALSRPLLVLSLATTFSDEPESHQSSKEPADSSRAIRAPHAYSVSQSESESSSIESSLETSVADESSQGFVTEDWLLQIVNELESQGICLPERFNEDELRRFYTAANGDFPCLVSSIKKTIRWRETYGILTVPELEMWSDVVFWHGFDVKHRPSLIVRLGVACSNLPNQDRPRFAQAIISQIEHGVLHLVNQENPRITVIVDCEGLSPLKIPMQMMRSCSSLLQDNFPDRLGSLFVIRLPPVARVIAQTFTQVLKPVTRKKINILGKTYQKVLAEYLESLPSYLGGSCTCTNCSNISNGCRGWPNTRKTNKMVSNSSVDICQNMVSPFYGGDTTDNGNYNEVLRTSVIIILMIWALVALVAGLYNPDGNEF